MFPVTAIRPPDPAVVERLRAIDRTVRRETGHEGFPDAAWRALNAAPGDCIVAVDADATVGGATAPSDSFSPSHRQLAVTAVADVDPLAVGAVVEALLASDPAPSLTVWLPGSTPVLAAVLGGRGFEEARRQHRMEVPLPRPDPVVFPSGVELRPFRPATDDAAWLRVNNRAFANHPEQGGWVDTVLQRRIAEPWFDAAGFLLAWRATDLLGFCWTKVHAPGAVGEIFVIGVDPDAQGLGLGRALVLAGLADLAGRHGCRHAILYVAAGNEPALALYADLGFRISRTDTALTLTRESR